MAYRDRVPVSGCLIREVYDVPGFFVRDGQSLHPLGGEPS